MRITIIIAAILFACQKQAPPIINAVGAGAKLTKADAVYQGIWWAEQVPDSLVITVAFIKFDSIYYQSNMPRYNAKLTHVIGFKNNDDNLVLEGRLWRLQH